MKKIIMVSAILFLAGCSEGGGVGFVPPKAPDPKPPTSIPPLPKVSISGEQAKALDDLRTLNASGSEDCLQVVWQTIGGKRVVRHVWNSILGKPLLKYENGETEQELVNRFLERFGVLFGLTPNGFDLLKITEENEKLRRLKYAQYIGEYPVEESFLNVDFSSGGIRFVGAALLPDVELASMDEGQMVSKEAVVDFLATHFNVDKVEIEAVRSEFVVFDSRLFEEAIKRRATPVELVIGTHLAWAFEFEETKGVCGSIFQGYVDALPLQLLYSTESSSCIFD